MSIETARVPAGSLAAIARDGNRRRTIEAWQKSLRLGDPAAPAAAHPQLPAQPVAAFTVARADVNGGLTGVGQATLGQFDAVIGPDGRLDYAVLAHRLADLVLELRCIRATLIRLLPREYARELDEAIVKLRNLVAVL
jgi:hypothetical protein